jgi:hypothetical protein
VKVALEVEVVPLLRRREVADLLRELGDEFRVVATTPPFGTSVRGLPDGLGGDVGSETTAPVVVGVDMVTRVVAISEP